MCKPVNDKALGNVYVLDGPRSFVGINHCRPQVLSEEAAERLGCSNNAISFSGSIGGLAVVPYGFSLNHKFDLIEGNLDLKPLRCF